MHEKMPETWRAMTGTDPSWMPRIIALLMEDHPRAWRAAVSQAVSDNAAGLKVADVDMNARPPAPDPVGRPVADSNRDDAPCQLCSDPLGVHSTGLGCWLCDCTFGRVA
jgi:hypothetical protein